MNRRRRDKTKIVATIGRDFDEPRRQLLQRHVPSGRAAATNNRRTSRPRRADRINESDDGRR